MYIRQGSVRCFPASRLVPRALSSEQHARSCILKKEETRSSLSHVCFSENMATCDMSSCYGKGHGESRSDTCDTHIAKMPAEETGAFLTPSVLPIHGCRSVENSGRAAERRRFDVGRLRWPTAPPRQRLREEKEIQKFLVLAQHKAGPMPPEDRLT